MYSVPVKNQDAKPLKPLSKQESKASYCPFDYSIDVARFHALPHSSPSTSTSTPRFAS